MTHCYYFKSAGTKFGSTKFGTKFQNDARGILFAVAVHPSNQHDTKIIDELLNGLCIEKLKPGSVIYANKGYSDWMDYKDRF